MNTEAGVAVGAGDRHAGVKTVAVVQTFGFYRMKKQTNRLLSQLQTPEHLMTGGLDDRFRAADVSL